MSSQKSLEPEDSARLDQLSDAEEIQKNVAVERVDGDDPCMDMADASVPCGREFQGRTTGAAPAILPEVSLQMVRPQSGQPFDPARAVDGIGRGGERDAQGMLAVGDQFLKADDHEEQEAASDSYGAPPEGILIDPAFVGPVGQ